MTPTNGEARLDVSMLRFSRDGGLWAVANGRARKARGRTWIWTDEAGRGLTGPFRVSVNFLEDRRGGVWLTHFGKGVLHVRPDGRARRITGADGLPGTRVRNLLEDREGNVWLAIERAGLVRVRDAWFQTLSTDGPREIAVASVAADRDGAVWIGSMGDGLQRYRDGTLASYPVPDASAGGFVFSVVPDAAGRIWLSADREDLFYFDGRRIRPSPVHVHGVKTLLADREGGLWVGTKTGVARIIDGRLHVFGPEDGFERRDVRALALGPDGAVWIGSGDGTIYRFRDGRLTRFRPPDAQASHAVWALHMDAEGSLWAGTFRGGLLRLRDGRFDRFTTGRGLPEQHHLPDPRGPVAAALDRLAPGHLPRQQGVARRRRGEPARRRHLRPIGRPARARVHGQLSARGRHQPRRPAVVRDAQGPRVDRSARRRRGPAATRRDPRRAAARPAARGVARPAARGRARG